ncbi:hypothetical protein TNCV_1346161 [Trichonephila clavipes]|nr:hypothetical protein TNCV_1346161 [Trichonephila clavipes]
MPLNNKYRMRPVVWPSPYVHALVIIETESGFITEDHTPPIVALQLPEFSKNPVYAVYDVGSVADVLIVIFFYLRQAVFSE